MVNKDIKNPDWYVSKKLNPAKELFDVYDKIIGNYLKIYKENIIIATVFHKSYQIDQFFIIDLKIIKILLRKLN